MADPGKPPAARACVGFISHSGGRGQPPNRPDSTPPSHQPTHRHTYPPPHPRTLAQTPASELAVRRTLPPSGAWSHRSSPPKCCRLVETEEIPTLVGRNVHRVFLSFLETRIPSVRWISETRLAERDIDPHPATEKNNYGTFWYAVKWISRITRCPWCGIFVGMATASDQRCLPQEEN